MTPKAKLPFDPQVFPAKVGEGRTSADYSAAISCVVCRGSLFSAALLVVILAGAGCATVTQPDLLPLVSPATEPQTTTTVPASQPPVLLMIEPKATTIEAILPEVYDPWKGFNSPIHTFNTDFFDTYLMKPVAESYSMVMGEGERRLIRNVLDNLTMPKRLLNSLLVGKFRGAGRELARFLINFTLGGLGMTDVAKYQFGIEKSDTDFGQTLEIWGWTGSRYLVVPFMPSLTLRDGVGTVVDIALSPFTVFFPIPLVGGLAKDTLAYVNNRGLRLEIDQYLEEPLYKELRNSYFIQREELIQAR